MMQISLRTAVTILSVILATEYSRAREMLIFRPCGTGLAGFVQFVKWQDTTDNVWTGSFNFSFYPQLISASVEINYEPLVSLKRVYEPSEMVVVGNNFTGTYWKFEPKNGMGKIYRFDAQPQAIYPNILKLTVNGVVVCHTNPMFTPIVTTTQATVNLNSAQNQGQINTNPPITCGRKPDNYVNLIFQGDDCTIGQWPWHVAIFYQVERDGNKSYTCGGSLLNRNTVLTAAHCVIREGYSVDPRKIFMVAGQTTLSGNSEHRQERQGREIIAYPLYNSKPGKADIALIKTFYCFDFNDYVQQVCIMGPGYSKASLTGLYGTVIGFGKTENGTLSNVLKQTSVLIQNDATCLISDILYQTLLNDFNFCAGNGPNSNVNPCNGDSGGGLVIEYNFGSTKNWVIQGIVSVAKRRASTNQCDPTQYVVYTAVTPYYQWIMGHL